MKASIPITARSKICADPHTCHVTWSARQLSAYWERGSNTLPIWELPCSTHTVTGGPHGDCHSRHAQPQAPITHESRCILGGRGARRENFMVRRIPGINWACLEREGRLVRQGANLKACGR